VNDSHPGGAINRGIQFSGGTFHGPVAAASGEQITLNQSIGADADERLAQLERLLHELEVGASKLAGAQAEAAVDDVGRLREEVRHPRPDPGRISQLLGRLTAQVAPVAALLDVVNQVKDLVAPLLH
jgi:hypothetical protein